MPEPWIIREDLCVQDKQRRSFYEILRDQLDQYVLDYALVRSYENFREAGAAYPFVEKRELKPRARIPQFEHKHQNAFLIIFVEDAIPAMYKKYIRFFDSNKVTKKNLLQAKAIPLTESMDRCLKYMEDLRFFNFLEKLLPVDYALLIQRDSVAKAKNRYGLTHFHVRVDWPIAEAAEDLAKSLRYISKDLYEKGENAAEDLQKKFFEFYGVPFMAGGRRTAAIVAAQFLKKLPFISTVYVGSTETRAAIRISEKGVSKTILIKLSPEEMSQAAEAASLKLHEFRRNYIIDRPGRSGIVMFRATYGCTAQSQPPDDGKLREVRPDLQWISVIGQHLLPKPNSTQYAPITFNVIYN